MSVIILNPHQTEIEGTNHLIQEKISITKREQPEWWYPTIHDMDTNDTLLELLMIHKLAAIEKNTLPPTNKNQ